MAKRFIKALFLAILLTILYIIYNGVIDLFDIILGFIVSFIIGFMLCEFVLKDYGKILDYLRWFYGIAYILLYFTVVEFRSHSTVLDIIVSPAKMKPGIVRIPYDVESDYALVSLVNSITCSPGTVVIDVDEKHKVLYVHWIKVEDESDEGAREHVSRVFEEYIKNVFD